MKAISGELSSSAVYCAEQCGSVVLTFESVDEILKCDHSNESYWAVFSSRLFITLY